MRAPTRVTLTRASTLWAPRLRFESLKTRVQAQPFLQNVSTNPSSPTASWSCTLASAPTHTIPASAAPAVPGTRRGTPGLQGGWVDVQLTGELFLFFCTVCSHWNHWLKNIMRNSAKAALKHWIWKQQREAFKIKVSYIPIKSVECLNKHLFILFCCIFKISYSLAGATVCVLFF